MLSEEDILRTGSELSEETRPTVCVFHFLECALGEYTVFQTVSLHLSPYSFLYLSRLHSKYHRLEDS